jgi:hypothetical protein
VAVQADQLARQELHTHLLLPGDTPREAFALLGVPGEGIGLPPVAVLRWVTDERFTP